MQAHKKLKNLNLQPQQEEEEEEAVAVLDPNNLFSKEERPSYLHFIYDKHDIPARVIQQFAFKALLKLSEETWPPPSKSMLLTAEEYRRYSHQCFTPRAAGQAGKLFHGGVSKRIGSLNELPHFFTKTCSRWLGASRLRNGAHSFW